LRKTNADKIREAITELGTASPNEIMAWIKNHYPDNPVTPSSYRAYIIGCSVNHSSSHHYPSMPKFLWFIAESKKYKLAPDGPEPGIVMKISFSVKGLPPNNKNNKSMWGLESQAILLVRLRMQALIARNKAGMNEPFRTPISLSLSIHALPDQLFEMGDLDNYLSGICDALQPIPIDPKILIHELFDNPDITDINPRKPILFYDDRQIYGLTAIKKSSNEEPYYTITIKSNSEAQNSEKLTLDEINYWSNKYDQEHPWWNTEEDRIGKHLRRNQEFGLETLKEIIHWKFLTLPGRENRTLNLIKQYSDEQIREISRTAFRPIIDNERITKLRSIKGIGVALASTILTFYAPKRYCIYDIHVMRGFYGEKPKYMFTGNKHYLTLLNDIREIALKHKISVRKIEKAYFKKNLG